MYPFCANSTSGFPFTFRKNIILAWATLIKYHKLGGLNNRHLFLTVLEAEKSKIRVPAVQCLVRLSSWLHRQLSSPCVHMAFLWYVLVERERYREMERGRGGGGGDVVSTLDEGKNVVEI